MTPERLQTSAGAVVYVGKEASVQFIVHPILFRIIRTHDWTTYDGWVWLDGYALNKAGDAVERRTIFVQVEGLVEVSISPDARTAIRARIIRAARRNDPPTAAIPRPRTSPEPTAGRTQ